MEPTSAEQHYSLCWSDFQPSLVDAFRQLQEHADFVDVTLAVDGYSVQAHRLVLSACSPYFKKLLKCNPCQHPVVILPSVTPASLHLLLRFMYSGQVLVPRDQLPEFLHTADTLQISGLTEGPAGSSTSSSCSAAPAAVAGASCCRQSTASSSDSRPSSAMNIETLTRAQLESDMTSLSPATPTSQHTPPISISVTPTSQMATPPVSQSAPPTKRARTLTATELVASLLPPSITAIRTSAPPVTALSPAASVTTVSASSAAAAAAATTTTSSSSSSSAPLPVVSASAEVELESRASRLLSEQRQQLSSAALAARAAAVAAAHQDKYGLSLMEKLAGLDQLSASMADKLGSTAAPVAPLLGLPNFVGGLHHASLVAPSIPHHQFTNGSAVTTDATSIGVGYRGRMSSSFSSSALAGLTSSVVSSAAAAASSPCSSAVPTSAASLEMMFRLRATDPRPCTICGKTYKNAHTLRTHMEDKHSQCAGFRCVLCGTVAKSRNSLHSHMSRQHRGVSTRDLPLLPMPAPWNPGLAAQFIARSGGRGEVVRHQQQQQQQQLQQLAAGEEELSTAAAAAAPSPVSQLLQQQLEGGSAAKAAAVTAYQQQQMGLLQQLAAQHHHQQQQQQLRVAAAGGDAGAVATSSTGSAVLDTYLQLMADQGLDLSGGALASLSAARAASRRSAARQPESGGEEGSGGASRRLSRHYDNGDGDDDDAEDDEDTTVATAASPVYQDRVEDKEHLADASSDDDSGGVRPGSGPMATNGVGHHHNGVCDTDHLLPERRGGGSGGGVRECDGVMDTGACGLQLINNNNSSSGSGSAGGGGGGTSTAAAMMLNGDEKASVVQMLGSQTIRLTDHVQSVK